MNSVERLRREVVVLHKFVVEHSITFADVFHVVFSNVYSIEKKEMCAKNILQALFVQFFYVLVYLIFKLSILVH